MAGVLKALGIVALVGVILAAGAVGGGYLWLQNHYTASGPASEDTTFLVARGSGAVRIASDLENQGLIRDDMVFRAGVRLRGVQGELKAGEYVIPAGASMDEIVTVFRQGDVVDHRITFPEGSTTAEIVRIIEANGILTGEITGTPGEGTLLPETYSITRDMTRDALLARMAQAQAELVETLWPSRAEDLPFDTPEEAIILASIVEREAGGYEHDLVAGVFVNRLRCPQGPSCQGRAWRLQADATVHYGVNGGEPLFNASGQRRTLYRSELRNGDNPYNTYQNDGLTPGPIANPGRAAIEAVLNPADTNAMFFVADGSGGHVFAATVSEHERNVRNWRRIEAELIAAERANDGR